MGFNQIVIELFPSNERGSCDEQSIFMNILNHLPIFKVFLKACVWFTYYYGISTLQNADSVRKLELAHKQLDFNQISKIQINN